MNNAQIVSAVTKIILSLASITLGATLAKYGITTDTLTPLATEIASLLVALGVSIYAHYFHGNNPPSPNDGYQPK